MCGQVADYSDVIARHIKICKRGSRRHINQIAIKQFIDGIISNQHVAVLSARFTKLDQIIRLKCSSVLALNAIDEFVVGDGQIRHVTAKPDQTRSIAPFAFADHNIVGNQPAINVAINIDKVIITTVNEIVKESEGKNIAGLDVD